jgi:hypothetical protein
MRRRDVLRGAAAGATALPAALSGTLWAEERAPMRIAAVVTEYRENSHADVIVTKFLEGCRVLDTDFRPQVKIASLYLDQIPANDMGRAIAAKHGVPIHETIAGALTLGTDKLAVDGVLLIGEHGRYPYNELGQHLYPRKRFFDEAAAVMRRAGRAVPVFNDKHLSWSWAEAKSMYDTARELRVPFMAGSSSPVSWRKGDADLPAGAELTEAVMVGYGGVESYGFHTLEGLQCMAERRRGGETGVQSVRCLTGDAVWQAGDAGEWSWELLRRALARSEKPAVAGADPPAIRTRTKDPDAFVIEYADGLRATALMLYGLVDEFLFAGRTRAGGVTSTLFWLQDGKPFGHFARLSQAIEKMFLTGRPTYPVERTLLTTGILDAAMQSRHRKSERLPTPHLAIRYG